MGVRKLFRGLTDRYPYIISSCKESQHMKSKDQDNIGNPLLTPNLNGQEFHNLYVDLNGLIHQCYIPNLKNSQNGPLTNTQIFENVTGAIERLLDIVRPRVLLYIAIDGPAPLAKQQQQRQRRFFQARSETKKRELYDELVREVQSKRLAVPPYEELFDSNVISPGTAFMTELAEYLNAYIERKIQSEEWRFRVIFSDSQTPGEGEHKIMRFIRSQKENAGEFYHANMHHVIYGMDADLVFLTLSLHEPHTTIIRESVSDGRRHILDPQTRFKFLHIYTLREYLGRQFAIPNSVFQPNFERMVNDFIFFCSFLGNDFLPKLPTLDISTGALEILFTLYAQQLQEMGENGYLVAANKATFVPHAVEKFLQRITTSTEHDYVMSTQKKQASKATRVKIHEKKNGKSQEETRGDPNIKVKDEGSANIHTGKYQRACKHYNTPRGCFRGRACPYVHLDVEKVLDEEEEPVLKGLPVKNDVQVEADSDVSEDSAAPSESASSESDSPTVKPVTAATSTNVSVTTTTATAPSQQTTANQEAPEDIIYPRAQEVFVGQLPKSVTDEHLRDIFKDCGNIVKAVVVMNPFGNISKGFGFVTFDSVEGAQKALELGGKVIIDGRKIVINSATREADKEPVEKTIAEQYKDFSNELTFRVRCAEKDEIVAYEHPFGEIDSKYSDEALDHWKERYYKHHCDVIDDSKEGMEKAIRGMVHNYVQGLQFVIQYYLIDLPSWSYYYAYHRAPFASEVHSLGQFGDDVGRQMAQDDVPFRPLDQLLSILPIASNKAIPEPYRKLQTTVLKKYYPEDFPLDLDVKMHWEAHPLLPFMERKPLEDAINTVPHDAFTEEELARNTFHKPTLYVPLQMQVVPFPVGCMNLEHVKKTDVFESFAFTLKNPTRIFCSLLPGVQPTTWKVEKKVSYKFKASNLESNDLVLRGLRDQMAKMQTKIQELRKKLRESNAGDDDEE